MDLTKSRALQAAFNQRIPGGAHTYAKGDDQYPEFIAPYLVSGKGCRVRDVDGNEFIEYGMGLRSVTLGHAHDDVVRAAAAQMALGTNFCRPSPIELECAERLLELIPGAEMVKFSKNGSDATTAAVRLARAYTGRDLVAVCADHPFLSVDDWFIGTTPIHAGIPEAVRRLTVKFRYNDPESVRALFRDHPTSIACLMMEPEKEQPPTADFLHEVQRLCREHGTVFVLDEMITGFRWHLGGGQAFHGVVPDLSTFGKALGNGFAVAALVGKRELLRRGGLDHDEERVFLLSTTHGAETHALAAAIACMRIYRTEPVIETLWRQGERLAAGLRQAAAARGLVEHFLVRGRPCCLVYETRDASGRPSAEFRTLVLQETLRRGVIAPSLVVSYSHGDDDIDRTIDTFDAALGVYARALEDGIERHLQGRPVKSVYRSRN